MSADMYYTLDLSAKELYNNKFFRRPEVFAEARRVSSKAGRPISIYLWNKGFRAPLAKVNPDGSFEPFIEGENPGITASLVTVAQVLAEGKKPELAKIADEIVDSL